ncbi:hypothetical protein K227x_12740 [Rubripirellula lacrimiformis]|uniref:Tetratricopeptide repeat protein n=1 Tax=Rubripirellula lacrimiformis TaxID=1930273 RepID=A0A517N6Z5_9BACT|nr:hypothetical protein [Rubripirellula lacrimiformis]QDT02895.1 hypothetical protein K227x_12740 [Rubripirellula lacrimiformis]
MPNRCQSSRPQIKGSLASCRRVFAMAVCAVVWGTLSLPAPTIAGEPAETFLARLRSAKYFDTALEYLDRIDQYPGVDGEFKKAVRLEKAQTYIDAARASRATDARSAYLQDATTELSEFLKQGTHPRHSEASLKLGTLQMFQATLAMTKDASDDQRKQARENYESAAATFDAIVDTHREKLQQMRGAKIDAKANPELINLRDQLRGEFLQSMSMAGEARLQAAKTFKDPGKQGKEQLQQALKLFTDLSEKYDDFPPGANALASRGMVEEELGNSAQALDSFLRMLETPDVPELRDSQFQAASGLVRLSLAEDPAKYQTAIDRVQPIVDSLRPDERRTPSALQLQVDLAKSYLAKSKDTQNLKPNDVKRAESEGRQLLNKVAKSEGDHIAETNRLLADLGIDTGKTEAVELPTAEDPDSLEDAYAKAIDLYQAAENIQTMLNQAVKDKNADQQKSLTTQLAEHRSLASQILRRGLSMVQMDSDIEVANNARQLAAFLQYQDGRYRDAIVVGTFLAKNSPGTEMGMKGAMIARSSLQNLLVDSPSNPFLISKVNELADFTLSVWPQHAETPIFQRLVIDLALLDQQWDNARTRINAMQPSPTRSLMQRKLGLFLYQESGKARADKDETKALEYQKQAIDELQSGLDAISGNLADEEAMKAALVLAKLYLRSDNAADASKIMNSPKYGPATVSQRLGVKDDTFESDLYSTQLSLLVQQMTASGSDTDKLVKEASDVMDKLRESVKGDDASQRLSAIYMRMATDIRQQLETADPAQKNKLIGAFRIFLERISATTQDDATLQWIGQTVMQLAEAAMGEGTKKATGQAAELLTTASDTFERLKKNSNDVPLTVDYQLARAQRLLGNYKQALDTIDPLLRKNPNMLNAQMEAAQSYEQWASTLPPKFAGSAFKAALNGGRPDPKTKKNVIWGWGKISQLTSSKEEFRDTFFEARYHVALCRYLWGKTINQKSVIEQSVSDITKVAALYPQLGGPVQRQKFDQLLRLIQKDLGQNPAGLPPLP